MMPKLEDVMADTHHAWKKPALIVVVLLLFSAAPASHNTVCAQTVDDAVLAVEKHYQELSDLFAKTAQKNILASMNKTLTFEGSLWIKKPGKLRLAYTNGDLILVNAKAALFYSKKNEQVIKTTFSDFQHMNIPVAFLLGAAHLRDDFDVRRPDSNKPRVLELFPKKPSAAMKKLTIETDDLGRISGMTIFYKTGNRTEIAFTAVQEGMGVEDKIFEFKAPKGTEVIEQ
jgi:outer membrane lipoprotein-sorting protein